MCGFFKSSVLLKNSSMSQEHACAAVPTVQHVAVLTESLARWAAINEVHMPCKWVVDIIWCGPEKLAVRAEIGSGIFCTMYAGPAGRERGRGAAHSAV